MPSSKKNEKKADKPLTPYEAFIQIRDAPDDPFHNELKTKPGPDYFVARPHFYDHDIRRLKKRPLEHATDLADLYARIIRYENRLLNAQQRKMENNNPESTYQPLNSFGVFDPKKYEKSGRRVENQLIKDRQKALKAQYKEEKEKQRKLKDGKHHPEINFNEEMTEEYKEFLSSKNPNNTNFITKLAKNYGDKFEPTPNVQSQSNQKIRLAPELESSSRLDRSNSDFFNSSNSTGLNLESNSSKRNSGFSNSISNNNTHPQIIRRDYSEQKPIFASYDLNSGLYHDGFYKGANQAWNTRKFILLSTSNSKKKTQNTIAEKRSKGLELMPHNNGSFSWVSKSNKNKLTKKNLNIKPPDIKSSLTRISNIKSISSHLPVKSKIQKETNVN
jgi:hypothetical protein